MSWTDERIERLKSLWTKGMTASHIADELGGVSRNAVIGKAHRLGLQSRPSPVKPNEPEPKPKAKAKEKAPAAPVEAKSAPAEAAPPRPAPPRPEPEPESKPAPAPIAEDEPEAAEAAATEPAAASEAPRAPEPIVRSIGPGGFVRQGPSDQQAPIPPAPPRRLVPAKPSPEVAGKTGLLDLNEKICKWPIGHPGEPDFHFCGNPANPGFPYCVQHCGVAYQAQLPRRDRKPPPPLPFGGPRVR
ncbi:MAG: GcrA cell cycle regulator [Sphingomonadaceae bacterium]|nr:GcrA cell cycle regulator [Sphingomonadaceae bacterium]